MEDAKDTGRCLFHFPVISEGKLHRMPRALRLLFTRDGNLQAIILGT